ncbi:MAG: M20/M25/M40 family metallo-hydrolase [Deltaproteobacteria bacterium]|nr:M20/M25/M40 family metallo-hydrolase [Deltaproteobacteria bacterium]
MEKIFEYLRTHQAAHLARLVEWLKVPSISADSAHEADTRRAGAFIAQHLRQIGLTNVRPLPTSGHDVIYGEWLGAPGRPTIMIYGHYDVQPPDPVEQWTSPPFEPRVDDTAIYARGANDNKGQIMLVLNAIEAWLATQKRLPVNIRCLIEGDEESGPAGAEAIRREAALLACDAVVISDTPWIDERTPTILYGARGSGFFEIVVRGPHHDVHSGIYGGLVMNPAFVLCQALAKAKDACGRLAVPGFAESASPITPEERALVDRMPVDVESIRRATGVPALLEPIPGETHRSMNALQPTFEIVGMVSGYTGKGQKTIIPAEARAKVNCRLVPGQDPTMFETIIRNFFTTMFPAGVTWELQVSKAAPAWANDIQDPYLTCAARVASSVFGVEAVITREPASIPIVSTIREVLRVPVVLCGMGLPDDGIHSPREKFHLQQYYRGAECYAALFAAYGEMKSGCRS